MSISLNLALEKVRAIPDFPQKGVIFRDIMPLLADGDALQTVIQSMAERILAENIQVDAIVCPEARGFIFGTALAYRLGVGFIPVRKPGKLPGEVVAVEYQLEYGMDCLQIQSDAISAGMHVVLVDDVLATGGTMSACKELIETQGGILSAAIFLMKLRALKGDTRLAPVPVWSLTEF